MRYLALLGVIFLGLAACGPTPSTAAAPAASAPTPTTMPLAQVDPPRINSAMAYDAARHMLVLFGGTLLTTPTQMTNETWAWNGSAWQQLHPAASPPALEGVMAYDAANQQIILFLYDDLGAGRIDNQMWAWDGATWQQQHPARLPSARQPPHLVYDDAMRQAILFWEYGSPDAQSVTWAWNGAEWTQIAGQWAPANFSESAAYDLDQQAIVVYAAKGNPKATPPESPVSQTWIWNGRSWKSR